MSKYTDHKKKIYRPKKKLCPSMLYANLNIHILKKSQQNRTKYCLEQYYMHSDEVC